MDSRLVVLHHCGAAEGWGDAFRNVARANWTGCVPARKEAAGGSLGGDQAGGASGDFGQSEAAPAAGPEKPQSEAPWCPYRKPTQVGAGENRQANERTLVKELGKLTP